MQITLTLSEEVAERALALAQERDVTLEQLVAKLLEQASTERPGDEFVRLARMYPGQPDPGWKFNREECWDRSQDR